MYRTSVVWLLIFAACSSAIGPVPDGSYSLVQVNGEPLPAIVIDDGGGWRVTALSGHLTMSADRYEVRTIVRREVEDSSYVVEEVGEGFVRTRNDIVELVSDDGFSTSEVLVSGKTVEVLGQFTSARFTYRPR